MAKKTLSFQAVAPSVDYSATANTLMSTENTLWYGDYVSLNFQNGQKLKITSFGDVDEVLVILKSEDVSGIDAGTIIARLTPQSPVMAEARVDVGGTPTTINSADFYLAVSSEHKGKKIGYEVTGTNTTASAAPQDQDGTTIEFEDETYSADSTTSTTPIELDKGDSIKLAVEDSETICIIMFKGESYTGSGTKIRLTTTGYTAQTDDEKIIIVEDKLYTDGFYCTYNVVRIHESAAASTAISGTQVYVNTDKKFTLKAKDTIKNTGAGTIYIVREDGRILASLTANQTFFSTNNESVYVASYTSGATVAYEVTEPAPTEHTCVYSGESGVVQIKRYDAHDWVRVFGHAGLDYMLMGEPEGDGNDVMFYLNMTGINTVKIVCRGRVLEACINDAEEDAYYGAIGTL